MIRSRIAGIGSFLPPRIVTNADLGTMMDTSDEWIRQRSGIEERRWADSKGSSSELGYEASLKALASANLEKEAIDLILFATLSPDHDFPGTACFLQARLGIPGIPAIDVRQQCTGFIYGLSMADHFIRAGTYRNILVVGAEIHSKGLDKSTEGRDVSVLFGDGAGAVVVSAVQNPGPQDSQIYSSHLHADGSFARELWLEAPGMGVEGTERISADLMARKAHYPKMNGKTVFIHAVKRMPEAIMECLEANKKTVGDVDLFLFHQANLRINEMVGKQLGISGDKIFNTIQKFGNTTAATIPLGMDEAVRAGKLKKGMLVASAAFGSGFTWASTLLRW